MKLELKHLAAYIPFELNTKYDLHDVVGGSHIFRDKLLTVDNIQFVLDYCKPILRPLSDLTQEVEVGGERFVPIKEFAILYSGGLTEKGKPIWESDFVSNIKYSYYGALPYNVIEKLFEWHFDVFGLIPEGIAIDINTLNQ